MPQPTTIKTFVLALNQGGHRELLSFHIPVAGLNLMDGAHHEAAIELARKMPGNRYQSGGFVAFDEREPAARAFVNKAAASSQAPRVLIEMEGGLINTIRANVPMEVLVLDSDLEAAQEEDIFYIDAFEGAPQQHVQRHAIDEDSAEQHASLVDDVFEGVVEQIQAHGDEPPRTSQRHC